MHFDIYNIAKVGCTIKTYHNDAKLADRWVGQTSPGAVWPGSTLIAIWATSWENMFLPYANNKAADQPVHVCSLISTFVVRYLDSIPLLATAEISG